MKSGTVEDEENERRKKGTNIKLEECKECSSKDSGQYTAELLAELLFPWLIRHFDTSQRTHILVCLDSFKSSLKSWVFNSYLDFYSFWKYCIMANVLIF